MPKYVVTIIVDTKAPELEPTIDAWISKFIEFAWDGGTRCAWRSARQSRVGEYNQHSNSGGQTLMTRTYIYILIDPDDDGYIRGVYSTREVAEKHKLSKYDIVKEYEVYDE